ncbi:NAD(P)H-quinone oxidoreductase [Microtetraspora malaysiensis]|uniref:NAD(P)H-quinone oxidoreductase n=1 Tax=Microtetraspora malaysiensis TaxID=161358 RepID=UPI0008366043|nr:NAD(P)H-quinone oxidoreductase [Microtetraspora malaysiensis]
MRAIVIREPGGPEVLDWQEVPDPEPKRGDVLIDVAASAVNRADVLQRQGFYPPPKGASEILGLECSGTVVAVGADVEGIKPGDEVCALLAGGGYAERVAVPWQQVMPLPEGLSLVDAAGLPEVVCTVWSNVFMTARLRRSETLLVHGGASGIGTMAIQLAKAFGSRVIATAGSPEKVRRCLELGADEALNYREEDFSAKKADVILDIIGAAYLKKNLDALAVGGRLVVIGMQGGRVGELDLGKLLAKRASVSAAGLRARPVDEKGAICAGVVRDVWPLIGAGAIRPVIEARMPMRDAADAHRLLESGEHIGKILLFR